MKRIYEVDFEERWKGCKWIENSLKVAANGDLRNAISKARKHVLSQSFRTDDGKLEKCVAFRAIGVKVVAQADI